MEKKYLFVLLAFHSLCSRTPAPLGSAQSLTVTLSLRPSRRYSAHSHCDRCTLYTDRHPSSLSVAQRWYIREASSAYTHPHSRSRDVHPSRRYLCIRRHPPAQPRQRRVQGHPQGRCRAHITFTTHLLPAFGAPSLHRDALWRTLSQRACADLTARADFSPCCSCRRRCPAPSRSSHH